MIVYLASPNTQQQAEHCQNMPVLLSFAIYRDWLNKGYQQSFSRILIDSGAFSQFSTGKPICIDAYTEWANRWVGHADAIAGLDDISGDWKRSLHNYQKCKIGFPTFHETDPEELLPDLVGMARERGGWIGIGLLPPRTGREQWMRKVCSKIPSDMHIHAWAGRRYTHIRRLNSTDSTNWWRDAMDVRTKLPWLTYGECLEIVVKRYKRWRRIVSEPE